MPQDDQLILNERASNRFVSIWKPSLVVLCRRLWCGGACQSTLSVNTMRCQDREYVQCFLFSSLIGGPRGGGMDGWMLFFFFSSLDQATHYFINIASYKTPPSPQLSFYLLYVHHHHIYVVCLHRMRRMLSTAKWSEVRCTTAFSLPIFSMGCISNEFNSTRVRGSVHRSLGSSIIHSN